MTRSTTAFFKANTDNFIRGMTRMEQSTVRFEGQSVRSLSKTQKQIASLGRAALATFGAFSTVQAVRELGRFAEASSRIDNLLRAAGDNSDVFKNKLLAAAIESRAPIEELANALLRLQKVDPAAGIERNLARVATFQRLSLAGGRTSAEAASASLQLSQAIQSGRLQGDEFRSLSENAPIEFLDALAQRLGVARNELKALSSDGKILGDDLTAVLDDLEGFSRGAIENLDLTISQASENLRSAFTRLSGELDESLGASVAITGAMERLTGLFVAGSADADRLAASMQKILTVAVAMAGARGIVGVGNAFASARRESQRYLSIATQVEAKERQSVATAQTRLARRRQSTAQLILERRELARNGASVTALGAAQLKIAKSYDSVKTAQTNLTRVQERASVAADKMTAAQLRMNLAFRAGAIAGNAFRSVVAFLGGPVGAIVTLGFGLTALANSGETAADAIGKTTDSLSRLSEVVDKVGTIQGSLEADTDALRAAEDRLAAAIAARSSVSQTAAEKELEDIRARIAQNRELLAVALEEYQARLELSRQNSADATRNLIREGLPGFFDRPLFDPNYDFRIAAQDRADALVGGESTLRDEFATLQERLNIGEQLSRSDRERFDALQGHLATLDTIREREMALAELLTEQVATLDVIGSHIERNAIGTGAARQAASDSADALERVAKRQQVITDLTHERARLEADLALTDSDDVERTQALRIALAEVNDELEKQNPIVAGSRDQLAQILTTVQALIAGMDGVEFDGDRKAFDNAVELEAALQAALASGQDVGALDLSGFVSRLFDVQDAAYGAADALAEAGRQAQVAFAAANRAVARAQNRVTYADDPVGLAVANFNVDNPLLPTPGPDAARNTAAVNGQILATRELIAEEARLLEQSREIARVSRSGNRGGRSRRSGSKSEENEDLKEALNFIESMKTQEEKRADQLQKLIALRARLVEGTAEEKAAVEGLDVALQRLEDQAQAALGDAIYDTLIQSAQAGDGLLDTLGRIATKLIEMEGANFLSGLFGGGDTSTLGGAAGAGLRSFFGFAEGGVMTSEGPLPLRKYASGGIANSPQLALFGEGSGPEAFVPLSNGAIPVRLDFANLDFPDINRIRDNTERKTVRPVVINDGTVINIEANGRDLTEMRSQMRRELDQRDSRLVKTIREINEDDPNYLK